jgi:hypothetical protein
MVKLLEQGWDQESSQPNGMFEWIHRQSLHRISEHALKVVWPETSIPKRRHELLAVGDTVCDHRQQLRVTINLGD